MLSKSIAQSLGCAPKMQGVKLKSAVAGKVTRPLTPKVEPVRSRPLLATRCKISLHRRDVGLLGSEGTSYVRQNIVLSTLQALSSAGQTWTKSQTSGRHAPIVLPPPMPTAPRLLPGLSLDLLDVLIRQRRTNQRHACQAVPMLAQMCLNTQHIEKETMAAEAPFTGSIESDQTLDAVRTSTVRSQLFASPKPHIAEVAHKRQRIIMWCSRLCRRGFCKVCTYGGHRPRVRSSSRLFPAPVVLVWAFADFEAGLGGGLALRSRNHIIDLISISLSFEVSSLTATLYSLHKAHY